MTIKMDYILYEQKGNIATITINREKALNALNSQVLDELNAALDAVDLKEVRCLVFLSESTVLQPLRSAVRYKRGPQYPYLS